MKEIRIRFDSAVTPAEALERVAKVIESGLMSETRGIPHYCWLTAFPDGVRVAVTEKKHAGACDSFTVY